MKIMFIWVTIILALITIYSHAQTDSFAVYDNELLVYVVKDKDNNQVEVISQNGTQQISYAFPDNYCFAVTSDGRYLALYEENGNTIQIIHLNSQTVLSETIWDNKTFTCGVTWLPQSTILSIRKSLDNLLYYEFLFDGFNLTQRPDYDGNIRTTYSQLPYWIPNVFTNRVWRSPNPDIFLYESCPSGIVLNDLICDVKPVIYDVSQNQIIEELDVNPDYLRGRIIDPYTGRVQSLSSGLVAWSYDARYLAFCDCEYDSGMTTVDGIITIYDLQTDTYWRDENYEFYFFNVRGTLGWSSNSYILAVWISGGRSDIYPDLPNGSLNHLKFYDLQTNTYLTSEGVFDRGTSRIIWSPDSRIAAIWAKERVNPAESYAGTVYDLIFISTTTGEHSIIDTDVTEIITWRSICDFTVSDTANLISTMQAEPYSVICLDENGQYDLTAPLPDVAGDITIIGNGATLMMTGQNRILNVVYNQQWSRNGSLTLKDVILSGGNATEGGAIFNAGDLTLEDVTLQNHSAVRGGAIYNIGSLVMNGGTIQNNSATEFGGGIYNLGDMQLDGVNIRDNTAPEGSGVYQG